MTCEDGTKSGPQPMFSYWTAMASVCAGHCSQDAARVDLQLKAPLPLRVTAYSASSACFPASSIDLDISVIGLAESPLLVSTMSMFQGAASPDVNGNFKLGARLEGQLHGQNVDGKFVLADPPKLTVTRYAHSTCGGAAEIPQPTTFTLTPRAE